MPDMKTRKKTEVERQLDQQAVRDAESDLRATAEKFIEEFQDCEGDVCYSTYIKSAHALWDLNHSRKIAKCTKVGESWAMDKGVVGKYRYPHLR